MATLGTVAALVTVVGIRLVNHQVALFHFNDAMLLLPGAAAEVLQQSPDATPREISHVLRVELHDSSVCHLRFDAGGLIVDPWDTPVRFERNPEVGQNRQLIARSAGSDRLFNTADDITSAWRRESP